MAYSKTIGILAVGAALLAGGYALAKPRAASGDAAIIRSATSAAPAAVARGAAVVAMKADGSMRMVRAGGNGFTCMADNPESPGPDPMCMDSNAVDWAMAWIAHRPPATDKVGFIYMLAGGTDASNVDPYSQRPSAGDHWVSTGPHVMVVGSPSLLANYPSGPSPDTSRPYVMWAGTPYAHLMVPIR